MTRRLPTFRHTLRTRLALLYGGLFLASGAALLAFADILVVGARSVTQTAPVPAGGARAAAPGPLSQPHGADLHQVLAFSGVVVLLLAGPCVVLGWVAAGRALRPFRTIMTTAREISASNLHERLGLVGPYDEFTELGRTLDDLFQRLEASFESQRHFVANASHELRTPVTAERALLQVALADPDASADALRSTCEEVLTVSRQQERLIEALLTLAVGQSSLERRYPVDISQVAGKMAALRRPEAGSRNIAVDVSLAPAVAAGDPELIDSLVANLLENALRYNVAGGRVEVSTWPRDGRAVISVGNTGPVIPVDEVSRLFQPFQRLEDERTAHKQGHGLGLAIVEAIAAAHGAHLSAQARANGGLDVEVSFPGGDRTGAPPSPADPGANMGDGDRDHDLQTAHRGHRGRVPGGRSGGAD